LVKKKLIKNKQKKKGRVNYFTNLRVECYFSKIGCSEFSFPKRRGCQCNLPKKKNYKNKEEKPQFLRQIKPAQSTSKLPVKIAQNLENVFSFIFFFFHFYGHQT
jgi:hypothetical protein